MARRAGTSRPTLSAYEHGHKSPRLDTATRILDKAGFTLADRRQRARCYETIVREGTPDDIGAYVDGALLVDAIMRLIHDGTYARAAARVGIEDPELADQ